MLLHVGYMPRVFLHAPQSFHNLCLLARTLEVFGESECWVFDPNGLVKERYGKMRRRELRVVSAGAFEKITWKRVDDPERVFREHPGRAVATVLASDAVPLERFEFWPADLVVFGSESRGLPDELARAAGARLTISSLGQTQSLNLAVAVGVVLFEWHRQTASTRGRSKILRRRIRAREI
jgi:tRNA (guanosine-2'-O-)-methyltransferase